jgi:multidrug efflux pump subunit AcrA (membrane-fusion protein)
MVVRIQSRLCLIALLFFLLAGCSSAISGNPTPTPLPPLVSYEKTLYPVERGPIAEEYKLEGVVTPRIQDQLFFRASGYISRIPFNGGDYVKKGELLAELQIDDLLNQLQQAEIDLEVAQANLANRQKEREFAIARAEHNVNIAKLGLEQANASGNKFQIGMAEENLALAELALKEAKGQANTYDEQAVKRTQLVVDRLNALIAERQIFAPYDGILFRHTLKPGDSVEAFDPIITIGDPQELVIRTDRVFDLVNKINENSEATLFLRKDDDQSYPLKFLPSFAPSSTSEDESLDKQAAQQSTGFFYFSMPTPPASELIPVGKPVSVAVVTGRNEDALLLPPAVIREFGGLKFVILSEGDKQRRVEVQTGLLSKDRIEVIGDLKEGDLVVGP